MLKSGKATAEILGVDEPFKGLSRQEIYQMVQYFYRLRKEGKTIVIIDHTDDVGNYFSKTIMLENDNGILRG